MKLDYLIAKLSATILAALLAIGGLSLICSAVERLNGWSRTPLPTVGFLLGLTLWVFVSVLIWMEEIESMS